MSVLSASSAQAVSPSAGLWYYSTFHIQAAHDAGYTGKGVTIAVIDGQIDPQIPTLTGANLVVEPSRCYNKSGVLYPATDPTQAAYHATNVVSLISGSGAGYPGQPGVLGVAPGAKVLFYMAAPGPAGSNSSYDCYSASSRPIDAATSAINSAISAGANIISISLGAPDSPQMDLALANAQHRGIIVVGALSNDNVGGLTEGSSPATNNGVVGVQSIDSAGNLEKTGAASNIDLHTDVVGPGVQLLTQGDEKAGGSFQTQVLNNGTSFATPIVAGFLAMVKQKYPSATANQLIRSLITNTGVQDHPASLGTDGFGYGAASVTHMLAVDPSKYPDTNPLVNSKPNQIGPSAAIIKNPPTLKQYLVDLGITSGPTAKPSTTPAPIAAGHSASALLIVVVAVGVLIVLGIIVLIVVLARRRSRRSHHDSIS